MTTQTLPAVAVSVFEVYYRGSWPWSTARMACFTADTAGLIAAEPGVRIRDTNRGPVIDTHKGQRPLRHGDYVVRLGSLTDALAAEYVHANYSREPGPDTAG